MSNMDRNNIVERIQKKIKSTNLKPEEIQAIDKARSQVYNQTTVGGFIGAVGTFLMGRKRKISPFLMIPFVGGGFLIGSQVGMVSGIMSGMRTIKKLPDQARLVNLVKDIQSEVMHSSGYTQDSPTSKPRPMTPEEKHQYQQKLLNDETIIGNEQIQSDNQDNHEKDKNDDPWWTDNDDTQEYTTTTFKQPVHDDASWKDDGDKYIQKESINTSSDSAWDRIRQENNK